MPASCGTRGVLVVSYPPDGIQNGSPDGMALVDAPGQVLEFLSYEGAFTATNGPAAGLRLHRHRRVGDQRAPIGTSLQRNSAGAWAAGASSFGACNPEAPPPVGNSLSFSGRVPTDPALPVGYEDQLFATLRRPTNVTIPTTITWASETPAIASIDQAGVMHALAAGTATLRATADGRHHGDLLAADARRGGERRDAIRATPSSASPPMPTPAMTSSCATSSSRRRTTRTAARPTG